MMAAMCVDVFLLSCILCLFVNFGSGTERGKPFGICWFERCICGTCNVAAYVVDVRCRGLHCTRSRSLTALRLSIVFPLHCAGGGYALVGTFCTSVHEESGFPLCFTLFRSPTASPNSNYFS